MSGFYTTHDEHNENANPNAHAKTHFESFKSIIKKSNEHNGDQIIRDLMVLFNKSTLKQLEQMYDWANENNTDAHEAAAKMLDTCIEKRNDRKMKCNMNNEYIRARKEFNALIKNATDDDLIAAYKFTLNADKHCSVKHEYEYASKILDTLLENRGISRDECGNVYIITREFGTPYDPMRHRKTHTKSSHHRGGSYKKRRSKKRKTMRKHRK